MGIMTRMGDVAWKQLGDDDEFTRCLHSLGDVNPDRRYICHFPLDNTIWSFGSGYGGNALLGKKCLALRIASFLGQQQGWMAEHMLLIGAQSTRWREDLRRRRVSQRLRQDQFRDADPAGEVSASRAGRSRPSATTSPGCGSIDKTGHLRAINPEAGYFGVVPGTNCTTNPNAMDIMSHDTIYTNVAPAARWRCLVGRQDRRTARGMHRLDRPALDAAIAGRKAAHPNSRFTAPMANNPALDPAANDPDGVPVTAIVFGGRRCRTRPAGLPGVQLDARRLPRRDARLAKPPPPPPGQVGVVRRDPMAMLPFIGYNIRDYLVHWFRMRKQMSDCPRIFHVNWFRKDDQGKFLWPGFGENMRVLKWIIDRCHGRAYADETIARLDAAPRRHRSGRPGHLARAIRADPGIES